MSLPRLRDVCRDFGRNNPIAANIHRRIAGHVVGAGIVPSVQANKKQTAMLRELMASHLATLAIDYDGRLNLYGLQHLAMRTVVESGEALLVRYRQPDQALEVPLQVRLLEGDYLDHNKHGKTAAGNILFQGIEFTPKGKRVAYWLFDEHPGGGMGWKLPVSRRVEASEVRHIYRIDRPGQQRGIPWGAPGIMTMWDLASYEEAELMRQKIAACFCIFFTGPESGSMAAGATKSAAGNPVATLEPGLIQALPSGATVTTATPPTSNGYRDVTLNAARKICIAYGVPYEVGTGDLSGVSFISGRLGRIDFNIDVDTWRWHMLIPHLCDGVGEWFFDAVTLARGRLTAPRFTWTPPRRESYRPRMKFRRCKRRFAPA
jgi:lambda family phage portal protein